MCVIVVGLLIMLFGMALINIISEVDWALQQRKRGFPR